MCALWRAPSVTFTLGSRRAGCWMAALASRTTMGNGLWVELAQAFTNNPLPSVLPVAESSKSKPASLPELLARVDATQWRRP